MKEYQVIYADPAWQYGSKELYGDKNKEGKRKNRFRKLERMYDTMSLDDIKQLPVMNMIGKNAACFLWVTDSHLKEGIEVLESWGFKYKTIAFVWIKKTNKGNTYVNFAPWTLKSSEICLLGMRGTMGKLKTDNTVRQLIEAERTKHSKKPMEARERIEQLFADVNRIELFARENHIGWDAWGNEVEVCTDLSQYCI